MTPHPNLLNDWARSEADIDEIVCSVNGLNIVGKDLFTFPF